MRKKLRSIANTDVVSELMLQGFKLERDYFNKKLNKRLYCFVDTPELDMAVKTIRKQKGLRIQSGAPDNGQSNINGGIRNWKRKI